jgi:hypothetical protein
LGPRLLELATGEPGGLYYAFGASTLQNGRWIRRAPSNTGEARKYSPTNTQRRNPYAESHINQTFD